MFSFCVFYIYLYIFYLVLGKFYQSGKPVHCCIRSKLTIFYYERYRVYYERCRVLLWEMSGSIMRDIGSIMRDIGSIMRDIGFYYERYRVYYERYRVLLWEMSGSIMTDIGYNYEILTINLIIPYNGFWGEQNAKEKEKSGSS